MLRQAAKACLLLMFGLLMGCASTPKQDSLDDLLSQLEQLQRETDSLSAPAPAAPSAPPPPAVAKQPVEKVAPPPSAPATPRPAPADRPVVIEPEPETDVTPAPRSVAVASRLPPTSPLTSVPKVSAPPPAIPPEPAPVVQPEAVQTRPPVALSSPTPVAPDLPDTGVPTLPAASTVVAAGALTIQPDSLIQIRVAEDASLDGSYPVNSIGAVQLGYVGPVILYNKTEEQAVEKIVEVLRSRDFKNATVTVKIIRASYDRVMVAGGVNTPSTIKIGAGDSITLTDALLRAGGVNPAVRFPKVRIVPGGLLSPLAPVMPGDEYALLTEDGKPNIPDVYLRNNDLVQVFSGTSGFKEGESIAAGMGAKQVLVLGEVKRPGFYRFGPDEPCTLMHLIFKMGGLPPYANPKAIRIMRGQSDGGEVEQKVDARSVLSEGDPRNDFPLEDGDRIVVPARRISLF